MNDLIDDLPFYCIFTIDIWEVRPLTYETLKRKNAVLFSDDF